ncbi:MAG: bifunctional serine/threonine-protein kinase/formylglycine-generating enzyme family protein [Byssovorax sp.]
MPETEPQADPWKLCGTTIENKYRIASVVGDGGFGVVYRGVHKGFGELIAVKCLKVPKTLDEAQREGLLEQLRDEGKLLHRLSKLTSGIVQALDVGAFTAPDGSWVPYLVLEWLEGETLAEHMKARLARGEGPYPLKEAVALLEPAARALGVAHKQKVAHRDVKPPNLFVTRNDGVQTVKVLDFGIAKVLTDYPTFTEALEATRAGPTAFTPRYGAPEQFNKQRGASGPWTDVFALALILVEMITGKKALDGDDPTQLYIAAADPSMRPTARGRGAEVSDAVEQVLDKALSVEPKQRYADASELWDALSAAVRGEPLPSRPKAQSPAPDPMMGTAEFAANARLDVKTEGPGGPKALPLASTLPAESIGLPEGGASVEPPPAVLPRVTAEKRRLDKDDPMAETEAVAPAAAATREARRDATKESPREKSKVPAARSKPAAPAPAKRSIWPWLLLGLASAAGAAAAFVLVGMGDPEHGASHPPAHGSSAAHAPSAKAAPGSSTRPSAAPSASEALAVKPVPSASAALTSSAVVAQPAPPPPEEMALIAAATFTMGEGAIAKKVTISRPFYLDRREVTVRAFEACVEARMCSPGDHVSVSAEPARADASPEAALEEYAATWTRRCNAPQKALDQPMNCVDFASAAGFCKWKGRRLPTEAEWELAARGADGRPYPWGREPPECARACYDQNAACRRSGESVATCAAGSHPADRTPDGIFDLGGNVAEWVSDGFAATLAGGADPKGDPEAPLKVIRGGSFFDGEDHLRSSYRGYGAPVMAHATLGFRCAMDAPSLGVP